MKFLLTIYSDESTGPSTPEEGDAELRAYMGLAEELRESAVMLAGEPLVAVAEARTVRGLGADAVVTDGPFAETKEQLGGFYMLDVESRDEVIEWAKKIPTAAHGCIEVRQVHVIPGLE